MPTEAGVIVPATSHSLATMADQNGSMHTSDRPTDPLSASPSQSASDEAKSQTPLQTSSTKVDVQENSDNLNTSNGDISELAESKSDLSVFKKTKVDAISPPASTPAPIPTTTTDTAKPAKPGKIRPSLRGQYVIKEDGTGTWVGKWGMDDNAFNGGIVSPFSYESRPSPSNDGEDCGNDFGVKDATFSGYFMLGSSVPGKPSTKHEEKDISFRFTGGAGEEGQGKVLKVVGHGKNSFGVFELDGTYNLDTKELHCFREYAPKPVRPKKTRAPKRTRTRNPTPPVSAERGKRPRPTTTKVTKTVVPAEMPTRTGRIRRTPSHLIQDDLDMNTKAGPLAKIRAVLLHLISMDKEGWFVVPVDAEALGLTSYHKIIKQPMDLGTVKSKLDGGEYSTQEEIVEDIRLVFNNACTFNPVGHPVNRIAAQHLKVFESELKKVIRAQAAKNKKKVVESKKPAEPAKKRRPTKASTKKSVINRSNPFGSSSEDDDDDSDVPVARKKKASKKRAKSSHDDSAEVKVLRKQVEFMNKQLELIQQVQEQSIRYNSMNMNGQQAASAAQTISAPPPVAQAKKKEGRPLSYQEKRQLGQDIHKLPTDMIQGVIRIIQESGTPLGGDGDEVELDIEALDTPAHRKLQKYVRKCLSKARSQQSKQDIDSMVIG